MQSVSDVLSKAVESGAIVNIVYNGGSNPGASRSVVPLSITSTELVAREPTLRIAKTFKLSKIASATVGEVTVANAHVPPVIAPTTPAFGTLAEYVEHFKPKYVALGWHIVESPEHFGVCGHFRNGRPRKSAVVSIQFMDRSIETSLDTSTGELVTVEHELTGRERPWRVESKLQHQAKAFSDLRKAMAFFALEVSVCHPSR